jgi:hypothetical protein
MRQHQLMAQINTSSRAGRGRWYEEETSGRVWGEGCSVKRSDVRRRGPSEKLSCSIDCLCYSIVLRSARSARMYWTAFFGAR